ASSTDCPDAGGRRRLPDLHPLPGLQVQRLVRGDVERTIEGIDVADYAIDPKFRRGMGCDPQQALRQFIATLHAPGLSPAEKHSLFSRKAIDDGIFAALQGHSVRAEGDAEPPQVADVLPQG